MVIDVDALERLIDQCRFTFPRYVAEYLVGTRNEWLKPDPLPPQLSHAGRMEIMQRQVMQKPVEKVFDPYTSEVPEGEAWVWWSNRHYAYVVRGPRGAFFCTSDLNDADNHAIRIASHVRYFERQ